MVESYCLKSCGDCGREDCGGCKAAAFAQQCEIVRCCKEKNHESCESCIRVNYCTTRTGRIQMPEKLFEMRRQEAALQEKRRNDAAVLTKWVRIIFWSMIVLNVVALIGLLGSFVDIIRWVNLFGAVVSLAAVCWCYFSLRVLDRRFGQIAALMLAVYGISMLQGAFFPGSKAFMMIVRLGYAVAGILVCMLKSETYRDTLSGISRDLSRKWENQWELYKISLWMTLGGVVASLIPIVALLGLLALVGGLGLSLFVNIREYVYLWKTVKACEGFSGRKQIF